MKPLRVLVAEDDMVGRRILECFLKPYGSCTGAPDGQVAVDEFNAALTTGQPFDLLILDIGLPKLPGIEVLKRIRDLERDNNVSSDKKIKVIMLTGQPDVDNINNSVLLGAADYIIKPIEEQVLIRELQRLGLIEDEDDQWK